jgi:hypothetical protein
MLSETPASRARASSSRTAARPAAPRQSGRYSASGCVATRTVWTSYPRSANALRARARKSSADRKARASAGFASRAPAVIVRIRKEGRSARARLASAARAAPGAEPGAEGREKAAPREVSGHGRGMFAAAVEPTSSSVILRPTARAGLGSLAIPRRARRRRHPRRTGTGRGGGPSPAAPRTGMRAPPRAGAYCRQGAFGSGFGLSTTTR